MFDWLRRTGGAVKHLLTAKDGETYTPARVYWCLGALQFLVLSAWTVIGHQQPFDPVTYSTGLGAILVSGGVGVWITRKSEPDE